MRPWVGMPMLSELTLHGHPKLEKNGSGSGF